jgi:hypothetical protein
VTGNDDRLWGCDPTPAIVSVWADRTGGALVREDVTFRPWLLLDSLENLEASGAP